MTLLGRFAGAGILLVAGLFYQSIILAQTLPVEPTPPPSEMPATEAEAPAPPEGPTLSNVSVTDITDTSARITVESDELVQGYVEYGTSEQYGYSTPLTAEFSTSPSFFLENLSPETLYHYRVVAMDAAGNVSITTDDTFTTLAAPTPPPAPAPAPSPEPAPAPEPSPAPAPAPSPAPTPAPTSTPPPAPIISEVTVSAATSTATISWSTSTSTAGSIEYGTTTSYGTTVGTATRQTSHNHTLNFLTPNTLYHFRIVAKDGAGNVTLGKDRTFTTSTVSTTTTSPAVPPAAAVLPVPPAAPVPTPSAEPEFTQGLGGLPVAPSPPYLLKVTPLDSQVSFIWKKDLGVKNGVVRTLIVRKVGTTSVKSRVDGDVIYNGPATTFTDTNVENGKEYHYALYSYGKYGRFTSAARFTIIPRAAVEEVTLTAKEVEEKVATLSLSRDLFYGRSGEDVIHLQRFLREIGVYPEGLVTGYFGPLTRAAVIRYQRLNGISPIAGYVGPLTRAALDEEI